jgi:hypothetical protein
MKKHVDVVAGLYLISGGLSVLIGAAMLLLGLGAAALAGSVEAGGTGVALAAGIAAGTFLGIAAVALVWAAVHLWNGWALRRCGEWARAVAIVLAVLNLFVLPFGTALGVYALWVLLNEETRSLFEPASA